MPSDGINGPLILASASPRRKELLENADIPFIIRKGNYKETVNEGDPEDTALTNAAGKAREAAKAFMAEKPGESAVILAADTIVAIDGRILGKPADEKEAYEMLSLLQGRTHTVVTGVSFAVIEKDASLELTSFHESTRVTFYPMEKQEILDYIAEGECLDKAGAYAAQGKFARYIKSFRGDYSNVVGLPIGKVFKELKRLRRRA